MEKIQCTLRFERPQKKAGGANSQRAEVVGQLMRFMNEPEDSKRFKYWLGRTRKLSASDIYIMMRKANDGKNPPALFNWLLKKNNDDIKNRRNDSGQKK